MGKKDQVMVWVSVCRNLAERLDPADAHLSVASPVGIYTFGRLSHVLRGSS